MQVSSKRRRASLAKSLLTPFITLVTGVFASVLVLIQPIWIERFFGDAAVKSLVFLLGVSGVTSVLASFGQTTGLFRIHANEKNEGRFEYFVTYCSRIILFTGLALSAGIVGLSIAAGSEIDGLSIVLIILVSALLAFSRFLAVALRLAGRHNIVSLSEQLLRELLFLGLALAAVLAGLTTNLTMFYFMAVLISAMILFTYNASHNIQRKRVEKTPNQAYIRWHIKENTGFIISDLGPMFLRRLDLIVASFILPVDRLVAYFLLLRLAEVGPFLLALTTSGLYDRFSQAVKQRRFRWFVILYGLQNIIVFVLFSAALAVLLASPLSGLIFMNEQLSLLQDNIWLLMAAGGAPILIGPVANALSMLDKRHFLQRTTLAWLCVHTAVLSAALSMEIPDLFVLFSLMAPAIYRSLLAVLFVVISFRPLK